MAEWAFADFFSSLLAIVVIDLVLAGDNAIVIGLSARTLPRRQQRRVIFWGTFGAVAIRSALTLVAVYLLKVPGLLGIGGLLLIWIACRLLTGKRHREGVREAATFGEALRTVLIADTVMGLDNVLAVAGAAHGDFVLVVLGLLISVPIVVWGSTLILRLIERWPALIYAGAGVLAWTAAKMVAAEPLLAPLFAGRAAVKWGFAAVVVAGVLAFGWWKHKQASPVPSA